MRPLAINFKALNQLNSRASVANGVLPLGLMLLVCTPLPMVQALIESLLGLAPGTPITTKTVGVSGYVLAALALLGCALLGYLLGWATNALIARCVLGWPGARVWVVYGRGEIPPEWQRGEAMSPARDWQQQRRQGKWRFVLRRGLLTWGGLMFSVAYVVPVVLGSRAASLQGLLGALVVYGLGGLVFGWILWNVSEREYRD